MRLLINASNLNKGGGIQVALSFINELLFIDNNITYIIVVSKEIHEQLDLKKFSDISKSRSRKSQCRVSGSYETPLTNAQFIRDA